MCGIAGYVGRESAVARAVDSLKRLEYRGYDSAGVAYHSGDRLLVARCPGKVRDLESLVNGYAAASRLAIAHTRWATHGPPSEANAHPHTDCRGTLAVVHNGIIENHADLRRELTASGHLFRSETDTEVISHLIETYLEGNEGEEGLIAAVRAATSRLRGSYALAVVWTGLPDAIVAARHESPLVIGLGDREAYVASDVPALVGKTETMLVLEDGDIALVRKSLVRVFGPDGAECVRPAMPITLTREAAEKGGYAHFMLKEIHEQPTAVRETLRERIRDDGVIALEGIPTEIMELLRRGRVHFVACGTAYHAGLIGKRMWELRLRRRADATVSSEFRYDTPLVDDDTLVILISQSGETADTLAAAREARRLGARTLGVVNCAGSRLQRETDATLITRAGPEIGVASTKAYAAQVAAIGLLAGAAGWQGAGEALRRMPEAVGSVLDRESDIIRVAEDVYDSNCFFFLGRGHDAAVAAEAALKLKEISYIHAEAYPAGEMKHGPLALVEPGVTVVGLCTRAATHEKLGSNLMEVKARNGRVIAAVSRDLPTPDAADDCIQLPSVDELLSPVTTMAAMQLLAYHVARLRGCPIDQPRNLAKSVTVE
ncbi:MAG: glutamine--fructose-6-phosphate transaminase (isomerizing) [Chthonomonadales bacterium]|nr:glutamine--fructose-6-phosphate transaminase (isomerizing) [Chthonomonadales bacterium]